MGTRPERRMKWADRRTIATQASSKNRNPSAHGPPPGIVQVCTTMAGRQLTVAARSLMHGPSYRERGQIQGLSAQLLHRQHLPLVSPSTTEYNKNHYQPLVIETTRGSTHYSDKVVQGPRGGPHLSKQNSAANCWQGNSK
jgi:hypothetical protein